VPLLPAATVAVFGWWPLGLDDGRLEEQVAMAAMLAARGDTEAAVVRADAVARRHPHPGTVHYRIGRALQDRGELAAAEAQLRRAAAIDRAQPEIDFSLGQVLVARGRPREALSHLLRASAGGIQPARTLTAIADAALAEPDPTTAVFVLAEAGRRAAASPDMLDAIGRRLLESRRGDLAEPYYLALERRFPQHAAIVEGLGLALLVRESPRRARAALERATRLNPSSASAALNLAIACVQVDDAACASHWVAQALSLNPDYAQARSLQNVLRSRTWTGVGRLK
jgi:tetratricopeptide (TPR) repeat protein